MRQEVRLEVRQPGGSIAQALGIAGGLACIGRLLRGEGSAEDASAADWSLEDRLTDALTRAGLAGIAPSHPFGTLSGGQRARLALARVLQEAPDILLLDEPTNNLNAGGRTLIAELLRGWRGCVIVASHDRALLACVDRIVEITNGRAISFGGPWPVFAAAPAARLEGARSALDHAEQASRRRHRARDQGQAQCLDGTGRGPRP